MNTLKNAQGKLKWNELHGQLWSSYILNSVEWSTEMSFIYTCNLKDHIAFDVLD